jgi:hypothetical protein
VRSTPLSIVSLVCCIVVLDLGILTLCLSRHQVDAAETVRILLSTFTQ